MVHFLFCEISRPRSRFGTQWFHFDLSLRRWDVLICYCGLNIFLPVQTLTPTHEIRVTMVQFASFHNLGSNALKFLMHDAIQLLLFPLPRAIIQTQQVCKLFSPMEDASLVCQRKYRRRKVLESLALSCCILQRRWDIVKRQGMRPSFET